MDTRGDWEKGVYATYTLLTFPLVAIAYCGYMLVGTLQTRYGIARAEAEKQVKDTFGA